MSFQDELNRQSKTPQEVDDDLRKSMDIAAAYEYSKIKEYMLSKVKRGEFTVIGSQKCVTVYHELVHDLSRLVKEEETCTKQATGFLHLQTKTVSNKRIVVDSSRRKEFEYFMECIKKYGSDDGMEIVPVMYNRKENIEHLIPTPYMGTYIFGYKFCLKCTMVY